MSGDKPFTITIVHVQYHCDDDGHITNLTIKAKIKTESPMDKIKHQVSTAMVSTFCTVFKSSEGQTIKRWVLSFSERRSEIVNLTITFARENTMTFENAGTLIDQFQNDLSIKF